MKIKYTVKPIQLDLTKERLNILISTSEELKELKDLAEKLGYKMKSHTGLPSRFFMGQKLDGILAHGMVNYSYKDFTLDNTIIKYRETKLIEFKAAIENGWIKRES